jgi:hypothetical protein
VVRAHASGVALVDGIVMTVVVMTVGAPVMLMIVVGMPVGRRIDLGTPTEVRRVEPSTPRLTVVPAAPAADERDRAVTERQHHLLGEPVIGVPPVREERGHVLAELFAEGTDGVIVGRRRRRADASSRVHGMGDSAA